MSARLSSAEKARIAEIALGRHLRAMRRAQPGYRPTDDYIEAQRRMFRGGAAFWAGVLGEGGWRPKAKR